MDLDEMIISMFVIIDDEIKTACQRLHVPRLRQRGPAPKLADAEVLAMECVGEFLGLDADKHIFAYFARHCRHLFPTLARTDHTTFARQAANLWHLKEIIWRRLVAEAAPADDRVQIVDSMPVPVCRFAHAPFCRRLRGAARYGKNDNHKDHADRQTFYGFRLHARLTWPGLSIISSSARSYWPRPTRRSSLCSCPWSAPPRRAAPSWATATTAAATTGRIRRRVWRRTGCAW